MRMSPGAMTLRILQTLGDLSNDKSTVVLPLPWEMLGGVAQSALKDGERMKVPQYGV